MTDASSRDLDTMLRLVVAISAAQEQAAGPPMSTEEPDAARLAKLATGGPQGAQERYLHQAAQRLDDMPGRDDETAALRRALVSQMMEWAANHDVNWPHLWRVQDWERSLSAKLSGNAQALAAARAAVSRLEESRRRLLRGAATAGMSQAEVARQLGVSRGRVAQMYAAIEASKSDEPPQ